jgi:hypothetical protein
VAYSSKTRSRTTRRTRKMSKKNKRINDFYQVQKMNYSGRSVSLLGNRQSFYVNPNIHYGYLPSQRGRPNKSTKRSDHGSKSHLDLDSGYQEGRTDLTLDPFAVGRALLSPAGHLVQVVLGQHYWRLMPEELPQ